MRGIAVVCGAALLAVVSAANAAGIPVVDAANISQNTVAAMENVSQTLKQIEEYKKQLEQFQEQLRNGMGLGDMFGQFQNMLNGFKNMQAGFGMNGGGMLSQFQSFQGGGGGGSGAVDGSNYFQSGGSGPGGGGGNYFSAQTGGGGSDFSTYVGLYGTPNEYFNMKQTAVRSYETKGSEAQIAANSEWINRLGDHQKRIDVEIEQGMEDLRQQIEQAGADDDGGTNKLLGVTNMLLAKLVEQNLIMQQMMITREMAEVTQYLNANARQMDMEAQARRLRMDAPQLQQQKQGITPLTWQ